MKLYSTSESIEAGEFTVLAAIETLIAIVSSIYIAYQVDSFVFMFVGICLAPLLLLRNPLSVTLSHKSFDIVFPLLGELGETIFRHVGVKATHWSKGRIIFIYLPLVAILVILIRIGSTLYVLTKHPTVALASIANNWWKVSFATDFMHRPAMIYGINPPNYSKQWDEALEFSDKHVGEMWWKIITILSLPLLYFPPLLYRFSLKATSLIYLPLVWLVSQKNEKSTSDSILLFKEITLCQAEKIKRIYAWIVIFVLSGLPIYFNYKLQVSPFSIQKFFLIFFLPSNEINSWHISRFLSAILTLVIFFVADRSLIRHEASESTNMLSSPYIFVKLLIKMRIFLSVWTIGCGIYLLYYSIDPESLPSVKWLPL